MSIEAPETEIVDNWRVACDGGEGALGHPRVWLQIDRDRGFVECPYCDKKILHRSFAPMPEPEPEPEPDAGPQVSVPRRHRRKNRSRLTKLI